jgi:hypothetical protein
VTLRCREIEVADFETRRVSAREPGCISEQGARTGTQLRMRRSLLGKPTILGQEAETDRVSVMYVGSGWDPR